jgi:hypothetical protein
VHYKFTAERAAKRGLDREIARNIDFAHAKSYRKFNNRQLGKRGKN